MEKKIYTYTHDNTNDTTIELVKCPGRTEIEIDFVHDDPEVGTEMSTSSSWLRNGSTRSTPTSMATRLKKMCTASTQARCSTPSTTACTG